MSEINKTVTEAKISMHISHEISKDGCIRPLSCCIDKILVLDENGKCLVSEFSGNKISFDILEKLSPQPMKVYHTFYSLTDDGVKEPAPKANYEKNAMFACIELNEATGFKSVVYNVMQKECIDCTLNKGDEHEDTVSN